MKPLVVITTHIRRDNTEVILAALEETTDLRAVELVIVDNGSQDGTPEVLTAWAAGKPVSLCLLGENIGCPQALNLAIHAHRQPGQPLLKLDNDGKLLTPGWLDVVLRFEEYRAAQGKPVALLCAHYEGMFKRKKVTGTEAWPGGRVVHHFPAGGICTWHTGAFMDTVRYFDVLDLTHRYGFDDLLMAAKARVMGWEIATLPAWQLENIQRRSAFGRNSSEAGIGKRDHVSAMRPLYDQRVVALLFGGPVRCKPDGTPDNDGGEL